MVWNKSITPLIMEIKLGKSRDKAYSIPLIKKYEHTRNITRDQTVTTTKLYQT